MNNNNIALIGVDLGGTKVAAGKIQNNKLLSIKKLLIPANSQNPNDIIDAIIEVIKTQFDSEVEGIGIGIPSLIDKRKGVVIDVKNIPSWKEIELKKILEDYFKVSVYLDNDANCFALGEYRFGKAKNEKDFVGLTLGTGMGGGIIKNGFLIPDVYAGAGEFGNIPYLDATYEDYCSGKFFKDKYNINGEDMENLAKSGDETAIKAFEEFGFHLGNAIKTIKLAVDPNKVVIGGSVAQSNRFFIKTMWDSIKDFAFPRALQGFDVLFSDVNNIAVLGAASLYWDRINE